MSFSSWYSYDTSSANLNAPTSYGVYELADSLHNTVYYGSGIIRTRLLDHLNKRECPMAQYFRYERTESEERARQRERALLDDYKTRNGKLPMYNERLG
mgnify:CR=1 FL=1